MSEFILYRTILAVCIMILGCKLNAQERVVISNSCYLVLSGGTSSYPINIVIDNSATNAITRNTSGHIISEGEYNKVKWNIGANNGSYEIPFGVGTTVYIPFKFNIAVGDEGVGAGNLSVATWYTAANAVVPTTGGTYTVCPSENNAIDRFWYINVSGYGTNPTSDIYFYYNPASDLDGIAEADLQAQRGNLALSCPWEPPVGTVDVINNYVEVINVSAFSPWTLVNKNNPLPIELLSFKGECKGKNILLTWETATEVNNDYYTVERSINGETFNSVAVIQGAGNSSANLHYEYTDDFPFSGVLYYRLKQTDYDGKFEYSNIFSIRDCKNLDASIYAFTHDMQSIIVIINTPIIKNYFLTLYNMMGEEVFNRQINAMKGKTRIELQMEIIASGIYLLRISADDEIYAKRIIL